MTPVRYLGVAETELLEEVQYFERQTAGLGRRFWAEVRIAEQRIAAFPEAAVEIIPGVRSRTLRKFPYSLIYAIEGGHALILAVAHHKRRPRYWANRLSEHE